MPALETQYAMQILSFADIGISGGINKNIRSAFADFQPLLFVRTEFAGIENH
jgi:hypothetical protein